MKWAGSEKESMRTMDTPITITRKKIKNMYLRVHPDGAVTVSAPKRLSDKAIREFVNSKADWIEAQLKKIEERKGEGQQAGIKQPAESTYLSGEIHYYWGCPCKLMVEETTGKSSVEFLENQQSILMHAPVNSTIEQRKHLLEEFYRRELKAVVPHLMEKYVVIVGKSPEEWHIRNMKTKWGTCNVRDKRIWLSLNLAKKHPDCLDYVIVHELTHLHVPNHSKAFWARMDVYYPQWREVRKLLNN